MRKATWNGILRKECVSFNIVLSLVLDPFDIDGNTKQFHKLQMFSEKNPPLRGECPPPVHRFLKTSSFQETHYSKTQFA